MKPITVLITALVAALAATSMAAPGERDEWFLPQEGLEREPIDWTVFRAYHRADAKADLPRVLLIGDSICNGYEGAVAKRLEGVANVTFLATAKACTSRGYFTLLETALDLEEYAVVHFNTGLHGGSGPLHEWGFALDRAMALIERKAPRARRVWVSSTPQRNLGTSGRIAARNEVARDIAKRRGWRENDLFALMDSHVEDRAAIWGDMLHFSGAGVAIQADRIAQIVREELAKAPPRSRPAVRANAGTEFLTWRAYHCTDRLDFKRTLILTGLAGDPFVTRYQAAHEADRNTSFMALSFPKDSAAFKRLVALARSEDSPDEEIDRLDAGAYPFADEERAARESGHVAYALGTDGKTVAGGVTFYPLPALGAAGFGYTGQNAAPCARDNSGITSPFKALYANEVYSLETVEVGGLKPGRYAVTLYLHFGFQPNWRRNWQNGSINEEISANGRVIVPRLDFGKAQQGDFWKTQEPAHEVEVGADGRLVLSFRQLADDAGAEPANQSGCFLNGLQIERK